MPTPRDPDDIPEVHSTGLAAPASQVPTPSEETEETYLAQLAAEIEGHSADSIKIKVFRIPERGPRELCRDYYASELLQHGVEAIRREWGPGRYELIRYGNRGIASRSQLSLAQPLTPVAPAQSNGENIGDLLRAFMASQAQILDAIRTAQNPVSSRAAILEEMKMLRDIVAPASNTPVAAMDPMAPMTMFREMLGVVREAKSAARELAGDEPPPEKSLFDLAAPVLEVVKTAMSQPTQPAPVQMLPRVQAPATLDRAEVPANADAVNANPAALEVTDEADAIAIINGQMAQLIQYARRGDSTIEQAAEFVADNLPDELLDMLDLPNWFELLSAQFPRLKPHEEWVRKVKARADALLSEAPEGEANP